RTADRRVLERRRRRRHADARAPAGTGWVDVGRHRRRSAPGLRRADALHAVHAPRQRHGPARDVAAARMERRRPADRGAIHRPSVRRGDPDPVGGAARAGSTVARPPAARAVARGRTERDVFAARPPVPQCPTVRQILWSGLYAVFGAAATIGARRAAASVWRVATGEQPPTRT